MSCVQAGRISTTSWSPWSQRAPPTRIGNLVLCRLRHSGLKQRAATFHEGRRIETTRCHRRCHPVRSGDGRGSIAKGRVGGYAPRSKLCLPPCIDVSLWGPSRLPLDQTPRILNLSKSLGRRSCSSCFTSLRGHGPWNTQGPEPRHCIVSRTSYYTINLHYCQAEGSFSRLPVGMTWAAIVIAFTTSVVALVAVGRLFYRRRAFKSLSAKYSAALDMITKSGAWQTSIFLPVVLVGRDPAAHQTFVCIAPHIQLSSALLSPKKRDDPLGKSSAQPYHTILAVRGPLWRKARADLAS